MARPLLASRQGGYTPSCRSLVAPLSLGGAPPVLALEVEVHRMSVSSAASSWVCHWLCTKLAYPCRRTRRGHVRGMGVLCYGGI